jgi:hypothetical protein
MLRLIFVLTIPLMTTAAAAQDARPSMPFYGTATMNTDDSLTLRLTRTADGKPVDSTQTYIPGDRAYDSVKRHLRGITPGQTRPLTPWKD